MISIEYVVYSIKCLSNSKLYFGRSQEVEKRWRAHKNMLRRTEHNNLELQNDWIKYGEEDFEFKIIHTYDSLEESIKAEQEYINSNIGIGYNIGGSVNGGDLFTVNPRKEEIRKMRSRQMSGKNNHQYGKKKTQKMIDRVKEVNSKKIIIDGVKYNSLTEASQVFSMKLNTISYRLNSKNFPNWQYDTNKSPTTSSNA